jgi:hypothetical protein
MQTWNELPEEAGQYCATWTHRGATWANTYRRTGIGTTEQYNTLNGEWEETSLHGFNTEINMIFFQL